MPVGDGKTIPPTGKAFRLIMCTVGHWNNGRMDDGRGISVLRQPIVHETDRLGSEEQAGTRAAPTLAGPDPNPVQAVRRTLIRYHFLRRLTCPSIKLPC